MPADRCTFATSDGRRCTSLPYPGHSSLCHQHLRKELDGAPPSEDIATDILSSIHNFQSAAAINAALGKVFALLAAGRIKRHDALTMAYLCQLMLQSLKEFKHEICLTTYEKTFVHDLLRVLNERIPLEEFVFPPPLIEDELASAEPAPIQKEAQNQISQELQRDAEKDTEEVQQPDLCAVPQEQEQEQEQEPANETNSALVNQT